MFYAAVALLAYIGKGTSKHGGVIALFDKHFIRPGTFTEDMSKALHRAFELRQIGDYRELVSLTDQQAAELLRSAGEFVSRVEAFLSAKLAEPDGEAP